MALWQALLTTWAACLVYGFEHLQSVQSQVSPKVSSSSDVCSKFNATEKTTVHNGTVLFSIMQPLPDQLADEICCSIASGNLFTNVRYRPSTKYKDQWDYICTLYQDGRLGPGNASTRAASAPKPPPPPLPDCKAQKTIDDCLTLGSSGPGASMQFRCSWSNEVCSTEPPIECGDGLHGPLCMNVILADHAIPRGPSGRKLGSFNWTAGTVTSGEPIVKMPTQIMKLGQSDWWSMGSGYFPNGTSNPFQVCVQYNELLANGTSDPQSGFEVCISGPGTLDITRGTTSKIAAGAGWGSSRSANGSGILWGQIAFWSNDTSNDAEIYAV